MTFDWSNLIGPAVVALFSAGGMGGVWVFHGTRVKAKADLAAAKVKSDADLAAAKVKSDADLAGVRATAEIKAPADMLNAMAAFQSMLNKQSEALTADLRSEIAALARQLGQAENRIAELEAENIQCRGENRQMVQRIDSLESQLRQRGIDIPNNRLPPGSLTVMEGDRTTVFSPSAAHQDD